MKAAPETLSPEQAAFLVRQRVPGSRPPTRRGAARRPCLLRLLKDAIYIALDEKPKHVPPTRLKRVRNIIENPSVALVADRYAEDWSLLAFVLVRGRADLLEPGAGEHAAAVRLLRGKYHQYETMPIEENPVISIRPERVASWGTLEAPRNDEPTVLDAVRGRRSVRRICPGSGPELVDAVPRPDAGPPPHGRQPWRFAVITRGRPRSGSPGRWARSGGQPRDGRPGSRGRREAARGSRRLLDAPVLVLLCLYLEDLDAYPDAGRQQSETTMAVQSLGAAAQNMLLAAYDRGLDAGWMCARSSARRR